ncbi:hypothetical protein [Archangium lipolyticum]|uniref:hypothetical protein n=1 Tax=Archangium lipolyticum TaxID=2970465 RepID=UPI00214A2B70|nr:hypothetical protein [Archangium lipolyticum]
MPAHAQLFFEAEPYAGASGAINACLAEALSSFGYELSAQYRSRLGRNDEDTPLATAERLNRLLVEPTADLAIFCDQGLSIRRPSRQLARKTLVLFHGLHGSPSTWLANPEIDGYCALSPYIRDVLRSLLTLPDWSQRRCMDPGAFHRVDYLVPPLPCVECPDGHPLIGGEDLPAHVLRAMEAGDVIGHAIQRGKADWEAVFHIILQLQMLARESGDRRPWRLVIHEQDFAHLEYSFLRGFPMDVSAAKAALDALELRLEDVLLPVPQLKQRELFKLFRAARFGLSYNVVPEPFGFYVLESVFNGCPVYTNGVGNNRRNLPPGHGIFVQESAEMLSDAAAGYAPVARRIFEDVQRPVRVKEACQQGREYILRTFRREAFAESLRQTLKRVESAPPPPPAWESLRFQMGPLVRGLDKETGQVLSDFAHTKLGASELGLVTQVVGRVVGEVEPGLRGQEDTLQALFSRGILTLHDV